MSKMTFIETWELSIKPKILVIVDRIMFTQRTTV